MSLYAGKVRSKKEKSGEIVAYSEAAMRHNGAILEYCRTSVSALSGCTAGILGLTGLWGFLFYFVIAAALWFMFVLRSMTTWRKFLRTRTTFLTTGLFGGLFTYVLFWTFFYGIVHVY
uniref:ER membrane protein complex subunit 6 n=1 Tax=Ornithodoros turicata TaxID=34597 RepID=A0A2R5LGA4_9ACAR